MTLNKRLQWLVKRGCVPSIYRRGSLWRAHVNMAGNFWEDHEDPCQALGKAVVRWKRKGCPMDGKAAARCAHIY